MAGPSVSLQLVDPGSAKVPTSTEQIPIYVDIAAAGSTSEVKTFSRPEAVEAEYTRGVLVDAARYHLAIGNPQVKCLRLAASTPGAASTPAGSGSSDIADVTGTPTQFLAVRAEIVTAPAVAVSGGDMIVRYSLDDWDIPNIVRTWSPNVVVPATGVLPLAGTGLSLDWTTTAEPEAGDVVTFTTTPGEYNAAAITGALSQLDSPVAGSFTFLSLGEFSTAALANTAATAVSGLLLSLFNKAKFCSALQGAGLEDAATTIAAIAANAANPPFLSLGYKLGYSSNPSAQIARGRIGLPQHHIAAARIATDLISTDPARTASGALRNIVGAEYDAAEEGDALHDARVSCFRTWLPAAQGVYIQRQRLLSAQTSNFTTWPHAAVMVQALRVAHARAFLLVADTLRRNANGSGTLDPRDAEDIEGAVNQAFRDALELPRNVRGTTGHVSRVWAEVDRTTQLPAIDIDIRIRPVDWPSDITFRLQYVP